jgi:ATP-dependent Clp protease ATP-binding subunit ClpA
VPESLSAESERVLAIAAEEAVGLRQDFIGTEHILLGLLACDDAIAAPMLAKHGIVAAEIRAQVAGVGAVGGNESLDTPPLTARAKQVLTLASAEAEALGDDAMRPEHLLLGIIRQATGVAALVLRGMGADLAELRDAVLEARETNDATVGGDWAATSGTPRDSPAGGAQVAVGATAENADEDDPRPAREVVPALCPGCGQSLSDVLAAASVVPAGSTALGRRRSFGNVTLIFCGACGHTLSVR